MRPRVAASPWFNSRETGHMTQLNHPAIRRMPPERPHWHTGSPRGTCADRGRCDLDSPVLHSSKHMEFRDNILLLKMTHYTWSVLYYFIVSAFHRVKNYHEYHEANKHIVKVTCTFKSGNLKTNSDFLHEGFYMKPPPHPHTKSRSTGWINWKCAS